MCRKFANAPYRALYVGQGPGTYTVDRDHARGAFRYLSLVNNGTGDIVLEGLSIYFTAAPTQDLQSSYTGYFHSNDELINRIWYAGAYTNREYFFLISLSFFQYHWNSDFIHNEFYSIP